MFPASIFAVGLICALFTSSQASLDDNKVQDSVDITNDRIDVDLGVPDVQATVGKLFSFSIPDTAFNQGATKYRYKVFKNGDKEEKLPRWLHFDEEASTLQGIPQMNHLGHTSLTVQASIPSFTGLKSGSQTSFNVEVRQPVANFNSIPSSGMEAGELSKLIKCNPDESSTYLAIQLDSDLNLIAARATIDLLSKTAHEMGVPRDILRLFTLNEGKSLVDHSSYVDGGPGDARTKRFANSAVVQWAVGCSGLVHPHHQPTVKKIESSADDGKLAELLGSPVIGWLVSKDSIFMDDERRVKRSVIVDAPIADQYSDATSYDEERELEQRINPSMASPTLLMPSASPTLDEYVEHHHHHRGVKTKGRHARAPLVNHRIVDDFFGGTPLVTPGLIPTMTNGGIVVTVVDERSTVITTTNTAILPTLTISPTPTTDFPQPTRLPMNTRPQLKHRVPKQSNTAGKLFSYKIPEHTFLDSEDGDTTQLKLRLLTEKSTPLLRDSWIQFDPDMQLVYSLPLEVNIGSYEFILEACDKEKLCVTGKFDISVQQHRHSRASNHKFSATLKSEKSKYPLLVDWRKTFVEKLAAFYGDSNTSAITVKEIGSNQAKITWSNDTLPVQYCPKRSIENLYKYMVAKKKPNHPSKRFQKFLNCCFDVINVGLEYSKSCDKSSSATMVPPIGGINVTETAELGPILRNPIDYINGTIGQVLLFPIPKDTFYSKIGRLRYTFTDLNHADMDEKSWIHLDPFKQLLYGLPLDDHNLGKHYVLTAYDAKNNKGDQSDAIIIHIAPRPKLNRVIKFTIIFDEDYYNFKHNILDQIEVAKRIARLTGDADTSNISVLSLDEGSVKFVWTNISLSMQNPPLSDSVNYVVNQIFNNNETLSQKLIDIMKPEFRVIEAHAIPQENHPGLRTPIINNINPATRPIGTEHVSSDDNIYITTIIPAVIIAAMLIIAAMIACILYRRRRKGKMTTQDNSTFVAKGIPIIFADELDDHKSAIPTNNKGKSPALMRDEKPPLPPPEYPRDRQNSSDTEGADSPLLDQPPGWGSRGRGHPDDSYAPSYEPPPPFSTNSNSRQTRPKPTPTYRNPPPYVPP